MTEPQRPEGAGRKAPPPRLSVILSRPSRPDTPPPAQHEPTFSTVHYRLRRDGWAMEGDGHEKARGRRLVGLFTDRNETHLLVDKKTVDAVDEADWEWVDFDGEDLLYACKGRVIRRGPEGGERLVADNCPIITQETPPGGVIFRRRCAMSCQEPEDTG